MSKEKVPDFILKFWRDSPTEYTRDDIFHLEPMSENAVFLKYIALNIGDSGGGGGSSEQTRGFITSDGEDFATSDGLNFTVQG